MRETRKHIAARKRHQNRLRRMTDPSKQRWHARGISARRLANEAESRYCSQMLEAARDK